MPQGIYPFIVAIPRSLTAQHSGPIVKPYVEAMGNVYMGPDLDGVAVIKGTVDRGPGDEGMSQSRN